MSIIKLVSIFENVSVRLETDIPNIMANSDKIHKDIAPLINALFKNANIIDKLQDNSINDPLQFLGRVVSRIVTSIIHSDSHEIGHIRATLEDLNNNMDSMI